jgi:hypothetical protein
MYNTESGWYYAGVGVTWGLHYRFETNGFLIDLEFGEHFYAADIFDIERYTNNFLKVIYSGSYSYMKTPPPPEGSYDYFIRFP